MSDQMPVCVHDSWTGAWGTRWRIRSAPELDPPFVVEIAGQRSVEWRQAPSIAGSMRQLAHRIVNLVSWLGIANVRAQDAGNWIRTAERPPKEYRVVLVALRGQGRPTTGFYGADGRWELASPGPSGEPYAWCEMPAVPLGWED